MATRTQAQAQGPTLAYAFAYGPPPLDPTARRTMGATMNNMDPTNEYMYHMPSGRLPPRSEAEPIDPQALKERLQVLGLQDSSDEGLSQSGEAVHDVSSSGSTSSTPHEHRGRLDHPNNPYFAHHSKLPHPHTRPAEKDPLRRYPTVHEVYPEDSISMYRPRPGPQPDKSYRGGRSSSARPDTARRGGTDIDPGDPGDHIREEYENEMPPMSAYSADEVTAETPRSMTYLDPTLAPGSVQTRGTFGHGGMTAMRDKLLAEQASLEASKQAEIAAHLTDTARLATTLTKLEAAEQQLRELQATLIAERVARTQLQEEASHTAEDMRDCREELASAVRALRRARDESKRSEEERKGLAKAYDLAQAKLHKYQLEISVREANARGRAHGRQEAWEEAARWMGMSPPIPVNPVQQIPETVLRQTPMVGGQALGQQQPQRPPMADGHTTLQATQPLQQQPHSDYLAYPAPAMPQQYQPMAESTTNPNAQTHGNGTTQISPDPFPHSNQPQGIHVPQVQSSQPSQYPAQVGSQIPLQVPAQPNAPITPNGPPTAPGFQQGQPQLQQQMGAPATAHSGFQNVLQPAPVIVPNGQPQQPFAVASQSVPHQYAQLPPQHPMRAASMVNQGQTHTSQPLPMANHSQPFRPTPQPSQPTVASSGFPQPPEHALRPGAADSYLDRIEHDARLQKMLHGAASKSLHTSQFPRSEVGESIVDKPLPNPLSSDPLGRSHTVHAAPTTQSTQNGKSRRRQSLSEGMHPNMMMSSIPDGDRYPAFPGAAPHGGLSHLGHRRGHSRSASMTSIDPAAYALPPSTMHSTYTTPQAHHRHVSSGSRQTPQSQSARARSRMAGALRNDGELAPGELSEIEEEDGPKMPARSEGGHMSERERDFQQSAIMRNVGSKPIRKVPSMPPSRYQPKPVMPHLLGERSASEYVPSGPRHHMSHQNSHSLHNVPGHGPQRDDPPMSHSLYVPPNLAPIAVSGGVEDVQGPRHSALGLEGIGAQARDENALGSGHNGHEESDRAGDSGKDSHRGLGGLLGSMKARTITIQPPSSRARSNVQSQIHSNQSDKPLTSNHTPTIPPPNPGELHRPADQDHRRQRQPAPDPRLHLENHSQPVSTHHQHDHPPRSVQPHEIPLPRSRSATISSTVPGAHPHGPAVPQPHTGHTHKNPTQPHEIPLPASRAPTAVGQTPSAHPHNIPLPPPRSHQPTAYDGSPPDLLSPKTNRTAKSHHSHHSRRAVPPHHPPGDGSTTAHPSRNLPSVSVIDYAIMQPLPESRGTTIMGTPKTAGQGMTEVEENTRINGGARRHPVAPHTPPDHPPYSGAGHSYSHGPSDHRARSHMPGKTGPDPRQIPLPPSRAPTVVRPRVSSTPRSDRAELTTAYARTENTIDEVTEEESGLENKGSRKVW